MNIWAEIYSYLQRNYLLYYQINVLVVIRFYLLKFYRLGLLIILQIMNKKNVRLYLFTDVHLAKDKKEIRLTDTCIVLSHSEFSIIPMHLIGFHENPLQKSQSFKTSY